MLWYPCSQDTVHPYADMEIDMLLHPHELGRIIRNVTITFLLHVVLTYNGAGGYGLIGIVTIPFILHFGTGFVRALFLRLHRLYLVAT